MFVYDAVDLRRRLCGEQEMSVDDSCRHKLLLAVGHLCGKAVKHYVSVGKFADHGEHESSSVLHERGIIGAYLACSLIAVQLLDNTLFKGHKRYPSVGDYRLCALDVAYLRQGKLCGDLLRQPFGKLVSSPTLQAESHQNI